MTKTIPLKALIRLALITAPLFAFIRVFPFMMSEPLTAARNLFGITMVFGNTTACWILNILLLYLFSNLSKEPPAWMRYIVSTVLCALTALVLFRLFIPLHNLPAMPLPRPMPPGGGFLIPVMQSISINAFVLVLIDLVMLRNKKDRIAVENTTLKIANLEARHIQLQQQLQPHFLFNSLNVLQALIKKHPVRAGEYVARLSELLRHSVHYSGQSMVTLQEEIGLCSNYLEMQQVRFGKALSYKVELPDQMINGGKVPSYSLQLLVENAIKHNRFTVESPLAISITAKDGRTITVANNLQPKPVTDHSGRTGLKNLEERYRILCNEGIVVEPGGERFMVHIKTL